MQHSTLGIGSRRPIACLKLQVIFHERATNYRVLLREMTQKDKASYDHTPPYKIRHPIGLGHPVIPICSLDVRDVCVCVYDVYHQTTDTHTGTAHMTHLSIRIYILSIRHMRRLSIRIYILSIRHMRCLSIRIYILSIRHMRRLSIRIYILSIRHMRYLSIRIYILSIRHMRRLSIRI